MENNFLFTIGHTVVALNDHSMGDYKKGEQFQVLDIKNSCCQPVIKIFPDDTVLNSYCSKCGIVEHASVGSYYWQTNFAPLERIPMSFDEAIAYVSTKKEITI